jgi:hypothetical protein
MSYDSGARKRASKAKKIALSSTKALPNTFSLISDSYGWYAAPFTRGISIATTTSGQTSITLQTTADVTRIKGGDRILLVTSGASNAVTETVYVSNSWSGPPNMVVPLTTAIQNSGLTYSYIYAGRMPSMNSWLSIALARTGHPISPILLPETTPMTNLNGSGLSIWGLSGGTTDQILGNTPYTDAVGVSSATDYLQLAINSGAKYLIYCMGTNNVAAGASADSIIADDNTVLSRCLAAGITPIIATLPPRDDASMTNAKYAVQQKVNASRRAMARRGALIMDINKYLADPVTGKWIAAPSTGSWGIPNNVYYTSPSDKVHPIFFSGAWAMGSALVDVLKSIFPNVTKGTDPYTPSGIQRLVMGTTSASNFDLNYSSTFGANPFGNFLSNGQFQGAGGGGDLIPGSGTSATNWNCYTIKTPTNGSFTVAGNVAKANSTGNPYDRGYSQTVSINQGSGTDYGQFTLYNSDFDVASTAGQASTTSTWMVGDVIRAVLMVKMTNVGGSGTTHETYPEMQINFFNGSTQIGICSALSYSASAVTAYDPITVQDSLMLATPPCRIPPGTTKMQMYIRGTGIGTFTFSDAEIRRLV